MHTHTRQYYLSDIPLPEALRKFHDALQQAGVLTLSEAEAVPLDQANGRITAAPVWAVRSSPHYDAAAMDGVAVRAQETSWAQEKAPLRPHGGGEGGWGGSGEPHTAGFDWGTFVE